ncbi:MULTISPECIES: PLP-dependent aminotransferase family protein [unclassified Arthrobacter]|uniref:MocR-like transcription factor YczR n=1 Tax=unclassified Arthrobacter TaxID=235627 RepID=UPI001490E181|nr:MULTISPECIES: PLP-dependent aminotransferase family protein [unclassified Arthrobacter]NOJ61079.1 PLP-dependent aminotransferase family protein [Arthrobacter sp. 260]NOJ64548.1 PLP-dependent aminotransferase family protein [Arthrobacter sp. 147(2020)]
MQVISATKLDSLLTGWRNGSSAYTALADRIRLLILDGRVPVGARLPAERDLAVRLMVSRTTVSSTYARLRESGYLSSIRGSGSVAQLPGSQGAPAESSAGGLLDFSKAAMPASPLLAGAAMQAAVELQQYLGGAGYDPVGLPQLRAAVAARYRSRGLPTGPEQILVTLGAQHAIALLTRHLMDRSDSAIVESPSYPHAYEAIRAAGRRLVPVNVTTEEGWDDDALQQAFRRTSPAIAYLMPDFHNPTGRVMGEDQRRRVLAAAERQGTVVIADETMAELAIDSLDLPLPLAAYGPAVLIGSLGKTIWGGLRIGWIRAETPLIDQLVRARAASDLGTPILEQLIAAELLGSYDQILAERRNQLRAGRDHLVAALRDRIPAWSVPSAAGGLSLWANLGRSVSSQLTLAARQEGLLIAAGPRFGIDGAFERFLRLPFSYSIEDTDRAVGMLQRAWDLVGQGRLAPDPGLLADVV